MSEDQNRLIGIVAEPDRIGLADAVRPVDADDRVGIGRRRKLEGQVGTGGNSQSPGQLQIGPDPLRRSLDAVPMKRIGKFRRRGRRQDSDESKH